MGFDRHRLGIVAAVDVDTDTFAGDNFVDLFGDAVGKSEDAFSELNIVDHSRNTFDIERGFPGMSVGRIEFAALFTHAETGTSAVIQAD